MTTQRTTAEQTAREYIAKYPDGCMVTFSALLHAMEQPEAELFPVAACLVAQAQIMRNTVKYHNGKPSLLEDAETLEAAAKALERFAKTGGEY